MSAPVCEECDIEMDYGEDRFGPYYRCDECGWVVDGWATDGLWEEDK